MKRFTVRWEFKPQDLWVGVFWKREAVALDDGNGDSNFMHRRLDVWVCLLPMLPIHLTWERRVARRCRACGCTHDHACAGGCYWVESDLCSACDMREDVSEAAWMCGCGHYEESDFHCSRCGGEPPWGCDCGQHDEHEPEGWEDALFEEGLP
jgi:hypothetical protein